MSSSVDLSPLWEHICSCLIVTWLSLPHNGHNKRSLPNQELKVPAALDLDISSCGPSTRTSITAATESEAL